MMRDLIPCSLPPLSHAGEGWGEGGKVHQLFGDKLNALIEELNETLAA